MKHIKIETIIEDSAMSLQEHDLRYHDNNYRGGKCMYREAMKGGDKSDAGLAEVNQREAALYFAWKQEASSIEDAIKKNFPAICQRNGARFHVTEADKDGVSKVMVWTKPDVADDAIDEKTFAKILGDLGFKVEDFSVMTQAPSANRSQGSIKGKKLFVADAKKLVQPKFAEASDPKKDSAAIVAVESGELDDARKSEMLKRFGVKSVGGKIEKRDGDDNAADRAKKYMGMVGDWQ